MLQGNVSPFTPDHEQAGRVMMLKWFRRPTRAPVKSETPVKSEYGDLKLIMSGWVMWDGFEWLACDGLNGTPDLIERPSKITIT
jgi:hypothetical protein